MGRPRRSRRGHALWLGLAVSLAWCGTTEAREFRFTEIARTGPGPLGGVVGTVLDLQIPTLNESGVVAFSAEIEVPTPPPGWPSTEVSVIFTGEGGQLTAMSDLAGPVFPAFDVPGINAAGEVTFLAFEGTYPSNDRIVKSTAGVLTEIASKATFGTVDAFPRIDDAGTVTFHVYEPGEVGLYQGDGTEAQLADYALLDSLGSNPDVTGDGRVTFIRFDTPSGPAHVFAGLPGALQVVAEEGSSVSGFASPIAILCQSQAINAAGEVAFFAFLEDGTWGLFQADGTTIVPRVLTSDGFPGFSQGLLDLNDLGQVAFLAGLGGFEDNVLYNGSDPVADRVIGPGDPLGGSTVTEIRVFFPPFFNNRGQIAFRAELADGTVGIYRADPVEKVPLLGPAGAGFLLAALLWSGWRLATRRGANPASETRG